MCQIQISETFLHLNQHENGTLKYLLNIGSLDTRLLIITGFKPKNRSTPLILFFKHAKRYECIAKIVLAVYLGKFNW